MKQKALVCKPRSFEKCTQKTLLLFGGCIYVLYAVISGCAAYYPTGEKAPADGGDPIACEECKRIDDAANQEKSKLSEQAPSDANTKDAQMTDGSESSEEARRDIAQEQHRSDARVSESQIEPSSSESWKESLVSKDAMGQEAWAKEASIDAKAPHCGDGSCDAGEDRRSCPLDCAAIWQPKVGTTWHWQLNGTLDLNVSVQMYDIDLFDTPPATITLLQQKGRKVICYFSAGSYEKWRPDASQFPSATIGQKMSGWDEQWLDIRATAVREIMKRRLDLAQTKGCDGVEPDNVDGYQNKTGFPLSANDQLNYNRFLATEAHARGLSIGLKNDLDQVTALVKDFDWALNEECLSYNECHRLAPFIQANKAVFHVEYKPKTPTEVCPKVKSLGFSSMIKDWDLTAWYQACW